MNHDSFRLHDITGSHYTACHRIIPCYIPYLLPDGEATEFLLPTCSEFIGEFTVDWGLSKHLLEL